MAIPAGLMPGGMPGAMPGGGASPMGGPEGQNPLGNPESALKLIASLKESPPQGGEDELFRQASSAVGMLYNRIASRSAKAAKLVSECLPKLQSAREALASEATRPMAPPPDLGLGMGGGVPTPTPAMPPLGM